MSDFTGKIAIVTGADHGFGRVIARGLADRGAKVHVCGINEASLAETAQGRMTHAVVDVRDRDRVREFVAQAGAVDILVNNAGGVRGQVGQPIENVTPAQWQEIFDVNLSGAFWFCQAVAPVMKAKRWGRIVNISSGAGLGVTLTGVQAYAAAKAGVISLTRQLGHELGPFGITVNGVAPGFIRSNPTTEKQWEAMGPEGQKRLLDSVAMRRTGSPDDIMHAVLFFASNEAGWITKQTLSVDGGR